MADGEAHGQFLYDFLTSVAAVLALVSALQLKHENLLFAGVITAMLFLLRGFVIKEHAAEHH